MQNQLEITSATGVDVQLNIAGPGVRSYAFIIDWHIRVLLALAWFIATTYLYMGSLKVPESESGSFTSYMLLAVAPAIAIYVLYHMILEMFMRGRTPGKRMAGVRIVMVDAQEPSFLSLFIRNLLRLLDSLPGMYVIGLLATVFTENSVRIGDIAAGTLLIYEADARSDNLETVPVSPEAIAYYGLAKAELAQDLLNRWDMLDDDRRMDLAIRLLPQMDHQFKAERNSNQLHKKLSSLLARTKERT